MPRVMDDIGVAEQHDGSSAILESLAQCPQFSRPAFRLRVQAHQPKVWRLPGASCGRVARIIIDQCNAESAAIVLRQQRAYHRADCGGFIAGGYDDVDVRKLRRYGGRKLRSGPPESAE